MRQRIMMAAEEEMKARSIKFTMADLATRLGVSKRLLYEHFSSKDELISAIIDTHLEVVYQGTLERLQEPELSMKEKLEAFFLPRQKASFFEGRIAEDIRRFLPMEWKKFGAFAERRWNLFESILREGIEKGELRSVSLPIVKKMIYASKREMIDLQFLTENQLTLSDVCENIADVLMYGMLARES